MVVTGGSDGMGRLLVEKFAQRGVRVIVLDIQEPVGGMRKLDSCFERVI